MANKTPTMGLTTPDINDKVQDTIASLAANFDIIDKFYPIGTIYQSTRNVSPDTFIGGAWTPLQGRVLVGAGTDFPAGTTGGARKIKLTTEQLPSHNHKILLEGQGGGSGSGLRWVGGGADGGYFAGGYVESTGAAAEVDVMGPYKAVYMWERTA